MIGELENGIFSCPLSSPRIPIINQGRQRRRGSLTNYDPSKQTNFRLVRPKSCETTRITMDGCIDAIMGYGKIPDKDESLQSLALLLRNHARGATQKYYYSVSKSSLYYLDPTFLSYMLMNLKTL